MIYLDSSIIVAQLLAEDRRPAPAFWEEGPFVSSRLLEYEVWNRINARGLTATHGDDVRMLFERVAFLELVPPVFLRALDPFPAPVRTLDVFHLASMIFLRGLGQRPLLATYDERLADAAAALDIARVDL